MKVVIGLMMLGVLGALGAAGFYMLRQGRADDPQGRKMARALALRVALSVAVFLLLLAAYALGWIQPTGIRLPAG
ncbi:MAG TPA: DUF2909 domain-containing protein [Rubrivivax sp.]|nr:DUF2909 domain-containing protein [Pseudomonadota bacterium]HOW46723.1 DUF2909 domain-containing protein [Rubrivivax sp.]HRY89322.1 DUF2909 domain-containing protein [Rubrivivax sp.]HRZ59389.1 DUF2909 domain-containing protein [Rubrivivax sp.]